MAQKEMTSRGKRAPSLKMNKIRHFDGTDKAENQVPTLYYKVGTDAAENQLFKICPTFLPLTSPSRQTNSCGCLLKAPRNIEIRLRARDRQSELRLLESEQICGLLSWLYGIIESINFCSVSPESMNGEGPTEKSEYYNTTPRL